MAASDWVSLLTALLFLTSAAPQDHRGETDTYYVSAGHLFLLRCHSADDHAKVLWSKADAGLPAGLEVRDGLLWFLPVQMSHDGTYTCEKRDETGEVRMTFRVSVSSGACPDAPETISITKGTSRGLPCKQTEIFRLNTTRNVRWMKDCLPVQREKEPILDEKGFLRLPEASETDAGKYTCLIDVSLDGRNYTAARSVHLTINDDDPELFTELQMVSPQQDVIKVHVGRRAELQCLAYTGYREDPEVLMYWTVDSDFLENYEELNETWKFTHDGSKVFGLSTLSISRVLPQFLNVPIECHISSPVEEKIGVAWLQEADYSALYINWFPCLFVFMAIVLIAGSFFFFKIDLILAHRKLMTYISKQQTSDGKSYDAYVSILQSETLSLDKAATFALQILPEELEQKHGYSLYIRGRDDCPGEATHDAITATVDRCRKLIIILSSNGETTETSYEKQNQLCYEQKVGLHHALMQNGLEVILVEIDGPVDYKQLPESLRYLNKKQGALKWKKSFVGTKKLSKLQKKKNFWKTLRYHMPPVPARRLQTVV
ncbi:interleukin-1 receptor type 1 isoform 2-T2 [Odontesthes bonariensis]|uniref:interleukin-1 receptor type 1 isoform X2 n=1 Tax=Odontesthes bonariensis TaxID=219752 RepID=UPI003F587974